MAAQRRPPRQWVRWSPRPGSGKVLIGELVAADHDTQMGTVRRLRQTLEVPLSMLIPIPGAR